VGEERGGFLGRWSRKKAELAKAQPLREADVNAPLPGSPTPGVSVPTPALLPVAPVSTPVQGGNEEATEMSELRTLSLDDVRGLTRESDFKPFMTRGVGPEVRNAAMKKLFEDPHFNVMDGLDIYIDDYSKADPIPESMLRQMVSAKFLKIFDEDEDKEKSESKNEAENKSAELPRSLGEAGVPLPESTEAIALREDADGETASAGENSVQHIAGPESDAPAGSSALASLAGQGAPRAASQE
jgi:Protein of unknown function (DUF3306)